MSNLDKLDKMTTIRAVLTFSLPSIVALFLESVTGIVDTAFAGNIDSLSDAALSAMGALNPIMTLLVAIQLLFGLSTGILLSRSIGENNSTKTIKVFKLGYLMTTLVSILVSLIIFIFRDNLIYLLGASGASFDLAHKYLSIAVISNVFSSVGYCLVNIIRSAGYPKMEVVICTVATIVNIALNTLFTMVLKMGIEGIALATLSSEILYFLWSLIYLKKKNFYYSFLDINIKSRENKTIIIDLFKIGFVQFFLQALLSLTGGIANSRLLAYGSALDLAVRAVLFSILQMLIMPLAGLSQGIQNVISFFIGRKNNKRTRDILNCSLLLSFIYGVVSYAIILFNPKYICSIFTNSNEIINLSSNILPLFLITFPLMGVFFMMITFMQVGNREGDALIFSLLKQVICFVPFIMILPPIFAKHNIFGITPAQSVFLANPLADIIVITLSIIYLIKIDKSLKNNTFTIYPSNE